MNSLVLAVPCHKTIHFSGEFHLYDVHCLSHLCLFASKDSIFEPCQLCVGDRGIGGLQAICLLRVQHFAHVTVATALRSAAPNCGLQLHSEMYAATCEAHAHPSPSLQSV